MNKFNLERIRTTEECRRICIGLLEGQVISENRRSILKTIKYYDELLKELQK